jgi:negative regulator of flagellin synthesis FlgM
MKINNFGKVNLNPYQKNIMKQEQIAQVKKSDKLEISSEALELQKGSPIELERQNLVKELKEKVQSGEYEIEPKKIAEKMYSYWNEEF